MDVPVYDTTNKEIGAMTLPEAVFNVSWKPTLVHQVITGILANRRAPLAHTKIRSEVRGGGKKPWRQKGTGRARVGSTRSPLWTGGGVTFGPRKDRNFEKKITKAMMRSALASILSKKLKDGEVKIINGFNIQEAKTKEMARVLEHLKTKQVLMVAGAGNTKAIRAGKNIPKSMITFPEGVNVYDCARLKTILFEKEAMEQFIEKKSKK